MSSSIPVYVGFWTDWSQGSVWGSSLTVSYNTGNIILATTAVFITIVGGYVWSITTYAIHQCLVRRNPIPAATLNRLHPQGSVHLKQSELIRLQEQLIFCNSEDPFAAVVEIFGLRRTWWSQGHRPIAKFHTIIYPFVIWAGFIIAGVLSSQIANQPEKSSNVRVQSQNCGLWSFNLTNQSAIYDREVKLLNDTLGGRIYARSCYADDWTANNPISCSIYTKRNLTYTKQALDLKCPFGPNQNSSNFELAFDGGECDIIYNNGSHQMVSAILNSHDDLGINAHPKDRVQFQKTVTCSPVSTANRTEVMSLVPGNSNVTNSTLYDVTTYNFGGINGVSSYTYAYAPSAISNSVGYQIAPVTRADQGGWTPIPPFYRIDGDVNFFFFAANSVQYTNQTLDPFYLALYSNTNGFLNLVLYYPYNPVSVMGCVDQYLIRNPNNGATAPSTGIVNLTNAVGSLGLNPAQNVTAQRVLKYFSLTSTYYSVFGSGPNALKQADLVSFFRSSSPPYGQWRKEVEGWFETTLASLQAYAVEYAANVANLGPYGSVTFPTDDAATGPVWRNQCQNQKISNNGSYQTFSVFGLMFIFSSGVIIILIAVFLERIVSHIRKRGQWPPAEIATIADDKFQLQRMMFEANGYGGWYNGDREHPWFQGTYLIPQPRLHGVTLPNGQQAMEVDYPQNPEHTDENGAAQGPVASARPPSAAPSRTSRDSNRASQSSLAPAPAPSAGSLQTPSPVSPAVSVISPSTTPPQTPAAAAGHANQAQEAAGPSLEPSRTPSPVSPAVSAIPPTTPPLQPQETVVAPANPTPAPAPSTAPQISAPVLQAASAIPPSTPPPPPPPPPLPPQQHDTPTLPPPPSPAQAASPVNRSSSAARSRP